MNDLSQNTLLESTLGKIQYEIHDSGFYNSCINGRKVDLKDSVGFPSIATEYRIANVIISKTSPVVTFRFISENQLCIFNELFMEMSLLSNSSVHCSLFGNDRFNSLNNYFGDITLGEDLLYINSPINFAFSNLVGVNVRLVDCFKTVRNYLNEGSIYNELCSFTKDCILKNSKFI